MLGHFTCRKELINEANILWKKYGSEYRILLDNYNYLLELKRALIKSGQMRKVRLDAIRKGYLKEYPIIEFLDYTSESEAMHYINMLDSREIYYIIVAIEDFAESALTQTLKAKVYDFNHQIQNRDARRSIYALDPDACKSRGKHSHHTSLSFTSGLNVSEK